MSELYEKVEKYVIDSYSKDGKLSTRGLHSLRTKEWLMKIYPEADETMQIAAVAHDIDSAFINYDVAGKSFKDPDYLEEHQQKSAEMIGYFLNKEGASEELIEKVKHLVSAHEVGGDTEQNIIKDADSLGFFDRNMPEFINRHWGNGSNEEQLREKIEWMYGRITTQIAKEFAKPMYEEAIKILKRP